MTLILEFFEGIVEGSAGQSGDFHELRPGDCVGLFSPSPGESGQREIGFDVVAIPFAHVPVDDKSWYSRENKGVLPLVFHRLIHSAMTLPCEWILAQCGRGGTEKPLGW